MSDLGAGINELEGDLLKGASIDLGNDGLSDEADPLLGANAASLDHDEVVVDNTVMGEATDGGDGLLGKITEGGSGVLLSGLANSVNLLV